MGETNSLLLQTFIYLSAALLAVPVAKRLGLGPVLGYLLAGVFVGPWGIALIRDTDSIALFLQISTILLLFLIALQATPARMRALTTDLFSIGMLQFGLATLLIMIVAMLIGLPWHQALTCGLALSLSSGAIAYHAFWERYPTGSPLTDTGKRLLLTQSLAVFLILVFLPLLGFEAAITEGSAWPSVVVSLFVVCLFAWLSHVFLKHLLRYVIKIGLDEVFAAFALLLIVGALLLMQILDLPMELGAFLAGLILTRSEYGSAISIAIKPFERLLVGMFFISVGMTIDFGSFILKPLQTLALVVLLVAIKAWVLRTILRFSAVPRQQRIWLAMVLSQSGELAFVVIAYAIEQHALPSELGSQLMIIIALSMLTTPVLMVYADRRSKIPAPQQTNTGLNANESADSQVIVAGFGRVGQVIARLMRENNFRTAVIDHNPNRFDQLRHEGFIGFYGDVLRPDLQIAAGIEQAAVMVIAIDDPERAQELVSQVRREYPHITISCRALDQEARSTLLAEGADRAYSESFESALLMGEDVLEMMGVSPLDARSITETYRDAAESS